MTRSDDYVITNTSIDHIPFEFNCGYYPKILFKKNVGPCSKSYFTDKLAKELRELIEVCYQNLLYAQKLQKKTYNKKVKSRSYAPNEKIWLNSKYIRIKRNKKLENNFFKPF